MWVSARILPGQDEDSLLRMWNTRVDEKGKTAELGIIAFRLESL